MSTTLTQQALDLITEAGAKGMSSGELALKIDCDFIPALLKPKCDDGTLAFSKVTSITGRQMNQYRLSAHAGADAVEVSAATPVRPAAPRAGSTERNGHDLLERGADLGRIPRREPPKPAPVEIPVFAQAKPKAAAPIEPARDDAPLIGAIEKGVPVPMRSNHGALRDQLLKLEPGDSFVTRYTKQAVYHAVRATGTKIVTRAEGDGQIRVWRKPA